MNEIDDKPLVWLHGQISTPPFSKSARLEAGFLLRRLQQGQPLALPHSRPMPDIAPNCHELRINDHNIAWRIVYHVDHDAIVLLDVFEKKTPQTPQKILERCRQRLQQYRTDKA